FFGLLQVLFWCWEILMLIGLTVESGHLRNWCSPRPSCLMIKEGLFSAARVFALTTVFFTCNTRRQVLEISTLQASPPRSPPHRIANIAREKPIVGELQNEQPSLVIPQAFSKH
ncbi:DUF1218 domain-containing protein, partial [Cephalotus follicularis]